MMSATQPAEVLTQRRAARELDGVIKVDKVCRLAAAGRSARAIPGPDVTIKPGGRIVSRGLLWCWYPARWWVRRPSETRLAHRVRGFVADRSVALQLTDEDNPFVPPLDLIDGDPSPALWVAHDHRGQCEAGQFADAGGPTGERAVMPVQLDVARDTFDCIRPLRTTVVGRCTVIRSCRVVSLSLGIARSAGWLVASRIDVGGRSAVPAYRSRQPGAKIHSGGRAQTPFKMIARLV
jgi:hypothetical protein